MQKKIHTCKSSWAPAKDFITYKQRCCLIQTLFLITYGGFLFSLQEARRIHFSATPGRSTDVIWRRTGSSSGLFSHSHWAKMVSSNADKEKSFNICLIKRLFETNWHFSGGV